MKILITPPFDSPIAPVMLRPEVFASILSSKGVQVVTDTKQADYELVGTWYLQPNGTYRLPANRWIVVDGEPPQPEYLLPHYGENPFKAVFTPATKDVYKGDCMAFYEPPLQRRPSAIRWNRRICQLATYRTQGGNGMNYQWQSGVTNGQAWQYRVLCVRRVTVGLDIREMRPELIDIYGRGWPPGIAVDNTRNRLDFLAVRHDTCRRYAFDLCWENMEIPNYVSEKFWSPVRMGVLPVYWGPAIFHDMLPDDTIVDCRGRSAKGILSEVEGMSFWEYRRRVSRLLDWYYELPRDAHEKSWLRAAYHLAERLVGLQ